VHVELPLVCFACASSREKLIFRNSQQYRTSAWLNNKAWNLFGIFLQAVKDSLAMYRISCTWVARASVAIPVQRTEYENQYHEHFEI
jgi:hypothetical protein